MSKKVIMLVLETKEDQEALIKALEKHSTITWDDNKTAATIKREPGTVMFKISKPSVIPPQRLRL